MEPTTPALHWAITSLGLLMMNSGEPITGSGRLCRTAGRWTWVPGQWIQSQKAQSLDCHSRRYHGW